MSKILLILSLFLFIGCANDLKFEKGDKVRIIKGLYTDCTAQIVTPDSLGSPAYVVHIFYCDQGALKLVPTRAIIPTSYLTHE